MSHSNYTGRIARSMIEINPYMRGTVEPMPDPTKEPKARFWQDAALYVIVPVVMAVIWWQA